MFRLRVVVYDYMLKRQLGIYCTSRVVCSIRFTDKSEQKKMCNCCYKELGFHDATCVVNSFTIANGAADYLLYVNTLNTMRANVLYVQNAYFLFLFCAAI